MADHTLRDIIYVNTDDFYASVLRARDPTLRERPVVVGYPSSRGVVVGASYEARGAGVRAGITMSQARRLCPEAVFQGVDWPLYRSVSGGMFEVIHRYSPVIEPVGLDEGFLDYTGSARLFGKAVDTALCIQREMRERLSLHISVGIAGNKLVSQVASKAAKRAGIVEVPQGGERRFLAEFPVDWLPGIGAACREILAALGVKRIETLAELSVPLAERVFGPRGKTMVERARGVDNRAVFAGRKRSAVEVGSTFPNDVIRTALLDAHLYRLAEALGRTLRQSCLGTRRIRLRLTYTDGYISAHSARLGHATALDNDLYRAGALLLARAFTRRVKVRALHLAATGTAPFIEQPDLFFPQRGKLANLYGACDAIREKYGKNEVIHFGKTEGLGDAWPEPV